MIIYILYLIRSYASLLASQGSLTTALSYVEITSSHKVYIYIHNNYIGDVIPVCIGG